MSAGTDKERVNELTARIVSYQNKVPADRLETVNTNDMQDELKRSPAALANALP